jgi:LemA protein
MKAALIAIGTLLLAGLIAFGSVLSTRNSLVSEKAAIDSAWAQVDAALRQRAELMPDLVELVHDHAKQEQPVLNEVTAASKEVLAAKTPGEQISANSRLDAAVGRLLVDAENYPQLKSNADFRRIQDDLAESENRIAVERQKYNGAVQKYNTRIELFPRNMAASMFGFGPRDYFRTDTAVFKYPQ